MGRRLAEHRAQICLLGLKEVQKFWRINNTVLDLFLQYLDGSIARRLRGEDDNASVEKKIITSASNATATECRAHGSAPAPTNHPESNSIEPHHFSSLSTDWEGGTALDELGLILDPQFLSQTNEGYSDTVDSLNFLERWL